MPPLPSYVEFTRGFGTHATSLGQLGTSKPTYKDRTNNERAAVRPPYGSLTNHGTDTIRTGTSYGTGTIQIKSELRYEDRANNERNYGPNYEPALLSGRVSTTERARLAAVSTSWLSWAGADGLRPMMKKKHPGNKAHMGTWPGLLAH